MSDHEQESHSRSLSPLYPGMPLSDCATKSAGWMVGLIAALLQLVGHVCKPAVRKCITPEASLLFHGLSLELFKSLEFCWADVFRAAQVHLGVTTLDQFPGDVSL